jgi:hypothetical protein
MRMRVRRQEKLLTCLVGMGRRRVEREVLRWQRWQRVAASCYDDDDDGGDCGGGKRVAEGRDVWRYIGGGGGLTEANVWYGGVVRAQGREGALGGGGTIRAVVAVVASSRGEEAWGLLIPCLIHPELHTLTIVFLCRSSWPSGVGVGPENERSGVRSPTWS